MRFNEVKKIKVIAETYSITDIAINGYEYDDTEENSAIVINRLKNICKEVQDYEYNTITYSISFIVDLESGGITDIHGNPFPPLDLTFYNCVNNRFSCSFLDANGNESDLIEYINVPECFQINDNGYDSYFQFSVKNSKIKDWRFTEDMYDTING